jgi:hypothetical protein
MSSDDRAEFAERLRLQLAARYRGLNVDVDAVRFALRLHGAGVAAVTLPLGPLYDECGRHPWRTAALIAEFVAAAETQLTARPSSTLSLARVVWCVRTRDYLAGHSGADELLAVDVAGPLVAFVAESLPNSIMRGVPRSEWAEHGEKATRDAATSNTSARFASVAQRIAAADRVAADGWRLSGDLLFQGSVLMVGAVLRAFADRAGGDVLIGVPDRSVVLAQAAGDAEQATRFRHRVVRTYRETLNPCATAVLITDGEQLRELPPERRPSTSLLDRLRG